MQRINSILPILFFFFIFEIVAQKTYQIPDGNFRSKLIISYPNLMVGGELDSAAAADFTGILNLQYANISDLDGVQYFTKLPELNIKDNKLTAIPQVSFLKKLRYLFVTRNKLGSLPDLSELKELVDLQVPFNNLKTIPPLDSLKNLVNFYCNDNQLEYLPKLSNLQNLNILVIGNNPFQVQPDFSDLKNLIELHVHQTNCDSVQGLVNLKKLQVLYAWSNKIETLPAIDSITTLRILNIYDNRFTNLPYLLNKPLLSYLSITNNYLTFEDLKPLKAMTYFNYFTYIPQEKIKINDYLVREKEDLVLQFDIDSSMTSCTYYWYKKGQLVDVTSKPVKLFDNVQFSDSGYYFLTVTNTGFPDLVLKTDSFKISVKPCLEIIDYSIRTNFIDCSAGFDLTIDDLSYQGASSDVVFQIAKGGHVLAENSTAPVFSNIESGIYTFQILDNKLCSDNINFTITSKSDCDQIFTPNGDGVMDSYFIDGSGIVKVYDMSRELVAELTAPVSWDGMTKEGRLAESGLYAIVLATGEIVQVTIIK